MNRKQIAIFSGSCSALLGMTWLMHYSVTPHLAVELAQYVDINARDIYSGISPLMQAAIDSDYERAKLLIEQGANVNEVSANADLDIPLNYALINGGKIGSLAVAELLIENGANVNAFNSRGVAPIHMLMLVTEPNNRWQMLNMLLSHGANINAQTIEDGSTMLHISVTMNDLDWIDRLNKTYGQIINYGIKDNKGRTPLDLAIQLGHVSVYGTQSVQDSLLRRPTYIGDNYDVTATDGQLRSGLQLAVLRSDMPYVKALLDHGADVNHQDLQGNTALHYALLPTNPIPFVQLLLARGANPAVVNAKGQTALWGIYGIPSVSVRTAVAKLLVDAGTPLTVRDKRGMTVLDLAQQYRDGYLLDRAREKLTLRPR